MSVTKQSRGAACGARDMDSRARGRAGTGLVGGLLPKSGGRLGTAPHAEINIR